jgi:Rrf2 family transcriptional regulator, nitric oxide-sensitive transcriptional repressor
LRLTLHSDLGLRLLMHLALLDDELLTISESAAQLSVSRNHLTKVALALVQGEWVASHRGRNGGLQLKKPARDIALGQVVRELETGSALVACFPGGSGLCVLSPACRLKQVLAQAQEAFFEALNGHSLADLVQGNAGLRALLLDTKKSAHA